MRKNTSVCCLQTIIIKKTKDATPDKEFEIDCSKLSMKKIKYLIVESEKTADGSRNVKINKQYNSYKTDGYIE